MTDEDIGSFRKLENKFKGILRDIDICLAHQLNSYEKIIKQFFKDNQKLKVIKADKTNKTVIIHKNDYNTKMKAIFRDRNMYKAPQRSPVKTDCEWL